MKDKPNGTFPIIILAGGLGTRLRGVIDDIPKCMAPVNGKPFLHYLFHYLSKQHVSEVILAVGYKREAIVEHFGSSYLNINVKYAIEDEPLGTGGGIKKGFEAVNDFAFVLNGDTFFDIELSKLKDFYFETSSHIVLALKLMKDFSRYGTVEMEQERVKSFEEKKTLKEGLINGGVYFFHKDMIESIDTEKFSFETDFLERFVASKKFCGKVFDSYFIDIGIPEDYQKAHGDFKKIFG